MNLAPIDSPPLRLFGSIALAEVARQTGKRRRATGRPPVRPPRYEFTVPLVGGGEMIEVEPEELRSF
jgi:hypothetical protein